MKDRISATLDKETTKRLKKLVSLRKYRNASHVIETALDELAKKEGECDE
jgi:Arc/MetJ-type ribon-helix-helix transcriptional regulator